jgi:hypothetical protein
MPSPLQLQLSGLDFLDAEEEAYSVVYFGLRKSRHEFGGLYNHRPPVFLTDDEVREQILPQPSLSLTAQPDPAPVGTSQLVDRQLD